MSYCNISYKVTNDDENNNIKMDDVWNKTIDNKVDKLMTKKQIIKKGIIINHFIFQS